MAPPPGLLWTPKSVPLVTAMSATFRFNPPPGFEDFQECSGASEVVNIPAAQTDISAAEPSEARRASRAAMSEEDITDLRAAIEAAEKLGLHDAEELEAARILLAKEENKKIVARRSSERCDLDAVEQQQQQQCLEQQRILTEQQRTAHYMMQLRFGREAAARAAQEAAALEQAQAAAAATSLTISTPAIPTAPAAPSAPAEPAASAAPTTPAADQARPCNRWNRRRQIEITV